MEVNYEKLLERSNAIKNFIEELSNQDDMVLSWKENEKKWSAIEVVSHLNKVYKIYLENFEKKLEGANGIGNKNQKLKTTIMGKLAIYTNRPKKEKISFKMKTFDFFEPKVNSIASGEIFELFFKNKERFNDIIKQSRMKDVASTKIPTALGEKMKFYIPECIDFLVSHEERHIVQINNILDKQRGCLKCRHREETKRSVIR